MQFTFSPKKVFDLTVSTIVLTVILASPVFAKPPEKTTPARVVTATPSVTPSPTTRPQSIVRPTVRLTTGLLTACQTHERVIKTRLDNLLRFANNMLDVFTKISMRVEDYYKTTVVPSGKTVDTYDALVSDISLKEAQVQSDLKVAQADADAFVCTGVDPKGHLTQFRLDMQGVKRSLKDFRTSIKNLIVAVRGTVAEETGTPEPTEGAK